MRSRTRRVGIATAVAGLVGLTMTGPAHAEAPPPFSVLFPAGTACAFDVLVAGSGGNRVDREFHDASGNLVRSISAGTGQALTFTNLDSGARYQTPSNGAVQHIQVNPDGTQTFTTTGHNILILFPTDDPAGPSTTLYVGRVVFTVDGFGNFTLRSTAGSSVDVCAALST